MWALPFICRFPHCQLQTVPDPIQIGPESARKSGLCLVCELIKSRHGVNRNVRQHLTVNFDASQVQAVDELAVGQFVHACCGIDTLNPQRAELALALATVAIGILTRLYYRLLGNSIDLAAGAIIALGLVQHLLVTLVRLNSTFNARHNSISCNIPVDQAYGIIRRAEATSDLCSMEAARKWRFRLVLFLVRI